jgi:hypothetical protein
MSYTKGQFDKGDLAGTHAVLVVFQDKEDAKALAESINGHEDPKRLVVTHHEVIASQYDIDYNIHKILVYPAEEMSV